MELLSSDQIDKQKWDAKIASSDIENIFCYSWYLDAVCDRWSGLIESDYETILPVPEKKTLGVLQMIQPPFTREIDIFGDSYGWDDVLIKINKTHRAIHFRNRESFDTDNSARKHQFLNLTEVLKFSTNAKRLIKKASHILFEKGTEPKKLINLFKGTAWSKIDSISEDDLIKLEKLMNTALDKDQGELIEAFDNGVLIAAGFFLIDKNRVTYLKGASTEEGKKTGVMFGLMDLMINKYKEKGFVTFDFGGSDVENVANFYQKFGAEDRVYYNYEINNLPGWFKTLKKFKK